MTTDRRTLATMRKGLTVLELLVTIGIITVVMGLILPAVHSARESARRIQCQKNLREIGLALHLHHDTTGDLPRGWTLEVPGVIAEGWAVSILPWLEQTALKEQVSARIAAWNATEPVAWRSGISETPAVFRCPSDSAQQMFELFADEEDDTDDDGLSASVILPDDVLVELPHANYLGVYGTTDPDELGEIDGGGTFIASSSIRFRDLTNGLSQVAIVAERTARRLPSTWVGFHLQGEDAAGRVLGFSGLGPNRGDADECEFDSRHPGGINMLFADGHVRWVADGIDSMIYRGMAHRQQ
jgi:prepilin-type processing-associated H-X9-DG protein